MNLDRGKLTRIALATAVVAAMIGPSASRDSQGYPKYRSDDGLGDCAGCHGAFDGPVSPSGAIFPMDSKHIMHRGSGAMNTSCNLCHYSGDALNPDLDFSDGDGFGGGPGYGCLGCHGRDYGAGFGVMGVGLREHHRNVGVASCGGSSCHADDPDPLPENVPPPYYGSFETKAWDACNSAPFFGENFSLETDHHRGLDNDGDLLYDEDDPDCAPTCEGDVDADGLVGFSDLLAALAAWGSCPGCAEDVDMDGVVGFNDLLLVLAAWGPCP